MQFLFYEVIVLLIITISAFFRRRNCPLMERIQFAGSLIFFGIISSLIVSCVPIPTERVIITALNQKNEKSSEPQIALASIAVDKKEYKLENPAEGKWFWRGNYYFWRPDTDSRRPDNLTQTIILSVPIGYNRTIGFDSWTNRGIVKVESGNQIEIVDTYGEQANTVIYVDIGRTDISKIFLFKLQGILIYIFLIAFMKKITDSFMKRRRLKHCRSIFIDNWDKFVFFLCSISMLSISILLSGKQSFWGDEIHNLAWAHWENKNISFTELIHYNLTMNDATPPLFNIVEHLWLCIAPYGQEWALLVPEVITACGVFFVGLSASRLKGKIAGVIATILACFSTPLYVQCSLELRAYCLLFTASSITLYVYILRYLHEMKKAKYDIAYGIILIILLYSHYYGLLIFASLLFADILFLVFRKEHPKKLLPYFASIFLFLPWIIAVAGSAIYNPFDRTWNSVPTISNFMSNLKYLAGNSELMLIVFLTASIYIAVKSFENIKGKKTIANECIYLIIAILPFALTFLIFVYSAYISPESSKWHSRYFVCIIPFIIVSISSFVWKIVERRNSTSNIIVLISFIVIYYGFGSVGYVYDTQSVQSSQYLYREAAEYVMQQNDVYDNKTAVLLTLGGYKDAAVGWDYYLTQGGKCDKVNSYSAMIISEEMLCNYETVYLFVAYEIPDKVTTILNNNFRQVQFDKATNVYKYVHQHN